MLKEQERRAYKHAYFAVRDEEAALDIVQDAMLKLVDHYADRPVEELPLLFHRILQNTIHDHFRRTKVRSTWVSLFSAFQKSEDEDDSDVLETLEVEHNSSLAPDPIQQLIQSQTLAMIEEAIMALPLRQRQAFLLRYWEEMDIAETAEVMGCSQGSVKTHCSRAVHALSAAMEKKGMIR
jgi:RNA polymerase sigma-70 factor, ECF subfamily